MAFLHQFPDGWVTLFCSENVFSENATIQRHFAYWKVVAGDSYFILFFFFFKCRWVPRPQTIERQSRRRASFWQVTISKLCFSSGESGHCAFMHVSKGYWDAGVRDAVRKFHSKWYRAYYLCPSPAATNLIKAFQCMWSIITLKTWVWGLDTNKPHSAIGPASLLTLFSHTALSWTPLFI